MVHMGIIDELAGRVCYFAESLISRPSVDDRDLVCLGPSEIFRDSFAGPF